MVVGTGPGIGSGIGTVSMGRRAREHDSGKDVVVMVGVDARGLIGGGAVMREGC